MVATHVQDQMELIETELWRLEEGIMAGLRQQTEEIITFHAMEDANREEEIKTGMGEEITRRVEEIEMEDRTEDRIRAQVEDRIGMREEKKAEAKVLSAR